MNFQAFLVKSLGRQPLKVFFQCTSQLLLKVFIELRLASCFNIYSSQNSCLEYPFENTYIAGTKSRLRRRPSLPSDSVLWHYQGPQRRASLESLATQLAWISVSITCKPCLGSAKRLLQTLLKPLEQWQRQESGGPLSHNDYLCPLKLLHDTSVIFMFMKAEVKSVNFLGL